MEDEEVLEPNGSEKDNLVTLIDRILDKGLVLNADITVSVSGVELLGIKIRAALASFETAAKFGLQFPMGTNVGTQAWQEAMIGKEECPQCYKKSSREQLLEEYCPWCGWVSAMAKQMEKAKAVI